MWNGVRCGTCCASRCGGVKWWWEVDCGAVMSYVEYGGPRRDLLQQ